MNLLLNEEAGLPSQSRCFSFRTTARACIGERRCRDSTSDANATSEESIVDGVVRARNTSRSSHARAIERGERKGLERERWRRSLKGPELTSWGRCDFSTWLSCWAIVVGAVSGLGWGMWGWVFACSRSAALKKWSTAS